MRRVEIDEAAFENDVLFVLREGADGKRDVFYVAAAQVLCGDRFRAVSDIAVDVLDIDVIAHLEVQLFRRERQHAPVDEVAAVTLGGVFLGDIGDAAENALAGRRLFARGTVSRLDRDDAAAVDRTLFADVELFHLFEDVLGEFARFATDLFVCLDLLRPADVCGIFAGKRKFRKFQGIGAVGRSFAGRDQLVRRGDGVVDDADRLDEHVPAERDHLRPVCNVRAVDEFFFFMRLARAHIDAVFVNFGIEEIFFDLFGVFRLGRGRKAAAVRGRRRDRARVHERDRRKLTRRGLAPLAAFEVARRMADGEPVVGGNVSRAEARAAERRFDDGAGLHEPADIAVVYERLEHGLGGRIDAERKFSRAGGSALHDLIRLGDVFVHAARAARDDALADVNFSVLDFVGKGKGIVAFELSASRFHLGKDLVRVLQEFADRIGVARVERQRDHRLDRGEVDRDAVVVIGGIGGFEFLIILLPAVYPVIFERLFVRLPNGRKASRFRGHHVDAVAVVHGKVFDAGADEFEDLIFNEPVFEYGAAERDGNVLRADALFQVAAQVHRDRFGALDVVRLIEDLLYELGAALAHSHRAERAVAGVRVAAQDHAADLRFHLAHVLVNDRKMGRHKVRAVLFRRGKAEHVVVFVDGAPHRAQGIVAVGERIGKRKFFEPARLRRLNDADVGDVVRGDRIEFDLQIRFVSPVMLFENAVRHGALASRFLFRRRQKRLIFLDQRAAHVVTAAANEFDHDAFLLSLIVYRKYYTAQRRILSNIWASTLFPFALSDLFYRFFKAVIFRLVKDGVFQAVGKVLLLHPAAEIVRIFIIFALRFGLPVSVAVVFEIGRDIVVAHLARRPLRRAHRQDRGVGFFRLAHVDDGVAHGNEPLGRAQLFKSGERRYRNDERVRVCHAHVFARVHHEPPQNNERIAPALNEAERVIERGVGIAPAQALAESGEKVVIRILVVGERLALDRLLRVGQGYVNAPVRSGRGGEHRQLQGVVRGAKVARAHARDVRDRLLVDLRFVSVKPLAGGERLFQRARDLPVGKPPELEHAAARHDGGRHGGVRVFRSGADEDDRALLGWDIPCTNDKHGNTPEGTSSTALSLSISNFVPPRK